MSLYIYYVPDATLNALHAIHPEFLSPYEVGTLISPHFIGKVVKLTMKRLHNLPKLHKARSGLNQG